MINKTCAKCGDDKARLVYDKALDHITCICRECGYEWTLKPLDYKQSAQA